MCWGISSAALLLSTSERESVSRPDCILVAADCVRVRWMALLGDGDHTHLAAVS